MIFNGNLLSQHISMDIIINDIFLQYPIKKVYIFLMGSDPNVFTVPAGTEALHLQTSGTLSSRQQMQKFSMRRDSGRHIDIIRLMMKYVHAVKDRFRRFQRPLRGISAIHFGYR